MNRERNVAGGNSYEKDLGFGLVDFLKERLEVRGEVAWLDLCCGTGRALIQAAELCGGAGVRFTGVDLVPMFDAIRPGLDGVLLVAASVEKWETAERFDLITCVHGLHYVGDKLGVLGKASGWLRDKGVLMAHLDYGNVRVDAGNAGKELRRAGFRYVGRRRLVVYEAGAGIVGCSLRYRYLGADDGAGPNFTGQGAVDSWYERVG